MPTMRILNWGHPLGAKYWTIDTTSASLNILSGRHKPMKVRQLCLIPSPLLFLKSAMVLNLAQVVQFATPAQYYVWPLALIGLRIEYGSRILCAI